MLKVLAAAALAALTVGCEAKDEGPPKPLIGQDQRSVSHVIGHVGDNRPRVYEVLLKDDTRCAILVQTYVYGSITCDWRKAK